MTGIPPRLDTQEDGPPVITDLAFSGPDVDCTRHIEADWDKMPEHVLLCIRYKGRRVGSLNPAYADIAFYRAYTAAAYARDVVSIVQISARTEQPPAAETAPDGFVGAYPCQLDDLTASGRLRTPARRDPHIPVAVDTAGSPCFRYAANAWYSELGDTVYVDDDNFRQAFRSWEEWKKSSGLARDFVTLIGTWREELSELGMVAYRGRDA
jgi:hypothetical protein